MLVRRPVSAVDFSTAAFDRSFQQLVNSFGAPAYRRTGPAVRWSAADGTLTLTVDLPGVPAEAIAVEVSGRTLTLKAEHDGASWSRSTRVGAEYDLGTVAASYVNGRLTVTVGSAPAPEVRQIAVSTTAPTAEVVEAVEATSTDEVAGDTTEG